jgi:hypothetical protein
MDIPYELIIKVVIIALLIFVLIRFMNHVPRYNRVDEGFAGVTRGSGHPDCLRTLPEASQILDVLQSHGVDRNPAGISDASADYAELELLLSKMACLKKDLMAPGMQVDSTRYQAFETAHDRVAVAELCGLCLSQNIPARDLDISFATWRDRGTELLRRLCTEANLKETEVQMTEMLFKKAFEDVYSVAKSRCLKTDFSKQNGGHTLGDVGAYESPNIQELKPYDNTYGGLSASGWNGAV